MVRPSVVAQTSGHNLARWNLQPQEGVCWLYRLVLARDKEETESKDPDPLFIPTAIFIIIELVEDSGGIEVFFSYKSREMLLYQLPIDRYAYHSCDRVR